MLNAISGLVNIAVSQTQDKKKPISKGNKYLKDPVIKQLAHKYGEKIILNIFQSGVKAGFNKDQVIVILNAIEEKAGQDTPSIYSILPGMLGIFTKEAFIGAIANEAGLNKEALIGAMAEKAGLTKEAFVSRLKVIRNTSVCRCYDEKDFFGETGARALRNTFFGLGFHVNF